MRGRNAAFLKECRILCYSPQKSNACSIIESPKSSFFSTLLFPSPPLRFNLSLCLPLTTFFFTMQDTADYTKSHRHAAISIPLASVRPSIHLPIHLKICSASAPPSPVHHRSLLPIFNSFLCHICDHPSIFLATESAACKNIWIPGYWY